jgi:hypothetical protein
MSHRHPAWISISQLIVIRNTIDIVSRSVNFVAIELQLQMMEILGAGGCFGGGCSGIDR